MKKCSFSESNRYTLSRSGVYIRMGLYQTKKARCYPRSLQSSCRFIRHLRMVENVGDLLLAVACSLGNEPVDIGSADGVIDLAIEVA